MAVDFIVRNQKGLLPQNKGRVRSYFLSTNLTNAETKKKIHKDQESKTSTQHPVRTLSLCH